MGVVYLASSPVDDVVAVKLIRADLAQDPAFRARFRREVDAARRVGGICTARVRDADLEGERPWVVTDFVAGPNLADLVARHGPLPADQQRALAAGLAEALAAVHDAGVIHRDLKPTNVLCSPAGPRLIDFGIAQAADATSATLTGQLVGSPSWMAPEQIRGQSATPAIDLFALGSVLAFAATGRPPFGDGQMEAVMYRILNEEPDLGPPGVIASELHPLIEALLSKDPTARPSPNRILTELAGSSANPAHAVTVMLDRTWVLPASEAVGISAAPAGTGTPAPRRRRRMLMGGLSAVVAVAAVVAVLLATQQGPHRKLLASSSTTTTATTQPLAPTTTTAPTTTVVPTTTTPTTVAVPATQASQSATPELVICSGTPVYEPTSMGWCSSMCSSYLTNISWSSWGQEQADGVGTWMTNNGIPNCAQGTWTSHPDWAVTLSQPATVSYCDTTGEQTTVLFTETNLWGGTAMPVFKPPCG